MATVQRKAVTTAAKPFGGPTPVTPPTTLAPGAIAQRAYEIWKESGCPNGKDQEHWFRAERELRARLARH